MMHKYRIHDENKHGNGSQSLADSRGKQKKGQGRRLRELWQLFKIMSKLSEALRLKMMGRERVESKLLFALHTIDTT